MRRCRGSVVICDGLSRIAGLGDACGIAFPGHNPGECQTVLAEVVGVDETGVQLLPFDDLHGIGMGAEVTLLPDLDRVRPHPDWRGRVLDPFLQPLDGDRPLRLGAHSYSLRARAVPAHQRRDLGPRLDLGVRALNLFTPSCEGQRMGIFAGAGVGKSTLLSMLARHARADALVLGLIGERGREVNAFLNEGLGPEGRARSTVVVATSDMPAMVRRRAAHLTLTIAEAMRDQGMNVLCLIDSVTRFAMALREIYLAAGEPPTSKGYPPGVFVELPRLLERAGPGAGAGTVTGLFTVLVEGDDLNDPVADAVRSILDGHIVLGRRIAEGGRFPAIDVLGSLSRTAPGCYPPDERPVVQRARQLLRAYDDTEELIQLGAYRRGSDPLIDEAIRVRPALEAVLAQPLDERTTLAADFDALCQALAPDDDGFAAAADGG